jgi:hypothetical protein
VADVVSGGGICQATARLPAGEYRVLARYGGDRNYSSSLARTTLRILPAPPVGPPPSTRRGERALS